MMEKYASNGGDEKKMWAAVAVTSKAMDLVKETHPEKYECYMRELSEILNGKHYTEELAKHDVAMMHSTDANGNKHSGAHWSSDEIESAVSGLTFPKGTTPWDRYVAYNATFHDYNKVLTELSCVRERWRKCSLPLFYASFLTFKGNNCLLDNKLLTLHKFFNDGCTRSII